MAKKKVYAIGNRIAGKWVIVSALKKSGTNTKIICYNTINGMFKEGWMQDFVRELITDKPNKTYSCKVCEYNFSNTSRTELYDCNSDYAFNQAIRTKNLTNKDVVLLRNIREGSYCDFQKILKKFADMLSKSGQHRRNVGLANVIASTYEILNRKGVI